MGYRILETEDIPAYLRERGHWSQAVDPEVREVSDGNMNRVFLASSAGHSLAVKQALPWVRVAGPSWPMNPDRADAEARAYERVALVAPDKIPAILGYDPENYALVMEDMSDLEVLRTLLNEGASYGTETSARIGEFVAQLTFTTSDFGMPSAERKALIAASVSPELCKITEDVVLSEPYIEHEHNHWLPELTDLAAAFRADEVLRTEVADLRHTFMTSAQALLHGDLHTGSVMVGERDGAPVVRVFDPEFSFVGPIGYDLGLYWANALVSEERARTLDRLTDHADQLRLSWEAFTTEFRRLWPTRVDTFFDDTYLDRFLHRVWTDAIGYAGTEIVRRIIGFAHLTDLTTLPHPAPASRRALLLGRELIVRREELTDVESVRHLVASLA
ncbi:S-methyl-5-thioribose kinase [Streptomyces acidiscabies]|uniref:S-methyl-5-thioribose kinase n=1 Tax=Streptomyces acidiscabies TaxID=42234 RepID=A0AAP6EE83_9ACTN|nr:S-methyl-5-thioribose kinase [Streptomyces acidiscabies]MBP5940646.1 S-methyl-5-thioribose kinase [Streptomyces sp. LBUM 1476]MBZ3911910.1 S-methyl-5-thioribose kinase [Streptomyces acidiscabies]MDX2959717.1 S-methyl-5-thioribose kinase [Streptomyces acidiscabies]MDX3022229.1 S-methyl-5-thioribose kinase [Streptomyces acidiscabies]MDX3792605.1 S-methyl-5-thioribose kinase [Streptomyces acidiscabies]